MDVITAGIGVLVAVLLLVAVGLPCWSAGCSARCEQGKALIISKMRKVDVTFTGAVVLPVLHKAEVMDISVKTIDIERTGKDGLICRDNIRADIRITFFVRVNKTVEDVIKVAQAIGTARASDQETLQELFNAKFSEALKTVGKQLDFVDLYTKRDEFRDQIIQVIGTDLNGYSLEDAAIDFLEQTPIDAARPGQHPRRAGHPEDHRADRDRARAHQRVPAHTRRRRSPGRTSTPGRPSSSWSGGRPTPRSSSSARSRPSGPARRPRSTGCRRRSGCAAQRRAHPHRRAARRPAGEPGPRDRGRGRRTASGSSPSRPSGSRRTGCSRSSPASGRPSCPRIAKDKEVEAEKRAIAEVIRERIAVEKTVAEQEEPIKRLRVVEEAERTRQAVIIARRGRGAGEAGQGHQGGRGGRAGRGAQGRARKLMLAEARQQAADLDAPAPRSGWPRASRPRRPRPGWPRCRCASATPRRSRRSAGPRRWCDREKAIAAAADGDPRAEAQGRGGGPAPRRRPRWPRWTTRPASTRSTGCAWRRRRRSGSPASTCSGRSPRRRRRCSPPAWRRPTSTSSAATASSSTGWSARSRSARASTASSQHSEVGTGPGRAVAGRLVELRLDDLARLLGSVNTADVRT